MLYLLPKLELDALRLDPGDTSFVDNVEALSTRRERPTLPRSSAPRLKQKSRPHLVDMTTTDNKGMPLVIQVEMLGLLYQHTPAAIFGTAIAVLITWMVFAGMVPTQTLLLWSVAITGSLIWRSMLYARFQRTSEPGSEVYNLEVLTTISAGITGLCLGVGGAVIAYHVSPFYQGTILLLILGMVISAIPFLGAVRKVYFAYSIGAVLPIALWCVQHWHSVYISVAVMVGVFIWAAWVTSTKYSHSIKSVIQTRYKLNSEIAQNNRAEKALKKNERLLKQAAWLSKMGHAHWDEIKKEYISVSEEYARIFGYTIEEFLERYRTLKQDMDLVHPEDWARIDAYNENHNSEGRRESIEYRILHRDGSVRHVRETCWETVGQEDILRESISTLQDISELKLTQKALEESENQFRQAAQTARLGHWRFDEVTHEYLTISDEYANIFGYTVEEFQERYRTFEQDMDLVHPEDRARLLKAYESTPGSEIDYRVVHADGSMRYVREISSHVLDEFGNVIEAKGTLQDITELKEAEQELKKSEARLERRVKTRTAALTKSNLALTKEISERQLAEEALRLSEARFRDYAKTAADYFWEMGPELKFTHIAGRFEEVTGIPPDRAIGLTHEELRVKWNTSCTEVTDVFPAVKTQQPFGNVEVQWNHPNQGTRNLSVSGQPLFDGDGVFLGYRGSGRDITQTHKLAKKLSYQASHDTLTKLINRREFERRLLRVMEVAQTEKTAHALCYLDLDQFKIINDTCGHTAGDELLRQLGAVLQLQAGKRETVARLGGDEFGVLLEHCSLEEAEQVANTFSSAIETFRFQWESKAFNIGVSIGLVPITEASHSMIDVMREADNACYAAKEQGRNRIMVYSAYDSTLTRRHEEMRQVTLINEALEENRFHLYSQPIVPVAGNGNSEGLYYELLLRMEDQKGRIVGPGAFLVAAERYNLTTRLDRWVVDTAFEWLSRHPEFLERLTFCNINLSGQSLGDEEFLKFVNRQFEMTDIPPEKICFEITETVAIANFSAAISFIAKHKERGCKFALDDFGTGLSSFAYLKDLPVDILKIDGTFVKDIPDNAINFAIVKSIHGIAHVMGKKTVAEHVEDEVTLEKLRELGVDYAQGYAIGMPRPIDEMLVCPSDVWCSPSVAETQQWRAESPPSTGSY